MGERETQVTVEILALPVRAVCSMRDWRPVPSIQRVHCLSFVPESGGFRNYFSLFSFV